MDDKRLPGTWDVMYADVVLVLARQTIAVCSERKVDSKAYSPTTPGVHFGQ